MASEMRRAAQSLVERHPQAFRSDYSPEEAIARLRGLAADGKLGPFEIDGEAARLSVRSIKTREEVYAGRWNTGPDGVLLEGEFLPASRTQRHLKGFAIAFTLLMGSTAWAFLGDQDTATRLSLALTTLLGVLSFPYVVLGLSSQRAARDATLAASMRKALTRPTP